MVDLIEFIVGWPAAQAQAAQRRLAVQLRAVSAVAALLVAVLAALALPPVLALLAACLAAALPAMVLFEQFEHCSLPQRWAGLMPAVDARLTHGLHGAQLPSSPAAANRAMPSSTVPEQPVRPCAL